MEDGSRREWEEKIRRKTEQVQRDWTSESNTIISLEDALVGVFADCYVKKEVPRVIVKDSEGATEEGLIKVFDKILDVMKTPTYHTLNYTQPEAVKVAKSLCLRDSITGGDHADRDASYVLWNLVGERPIVYWDRGRDLPQYSGEILEKLNMQFGNVRVGSVLKEHEELSRMLDKSGKIAYNWERRDDLRNGTTGMDAKSRIELGFGQLADLEQSDAGVDLFCSSVKDFVSAKDRERIPYRLAQYKLREIPVTMGLNTL
ncbi:hypothetical protein HQ545_05045 [Candidatus Woesearchaeota archaeon]|nr:hypothetical protein [Candidatus Woesearchaeota archaeon]